MARKLMADVNDKAFAIKSPQNAVYENWSRIVVDPEAAFDLVSERIDNMVSGKYRFEVPEHIFSSFDGLSRLITHINNVRFAASGSVMTQSIEISRHGVRDSNFWAMRTDAGIGTLNPSTLPDLIVLELYNQFKQSHFIAYITFTQMLRYIKPTLKLDMSIDGKHLTPSGFYLGLVYLQIPITDKI